ncbi:MAG: hypothetical protein ACYTXY_17925 [Nostoc sp.]
MTKTVIAKLSAISEKFLEDDLEAAQIHSQEYLYPYLETKKLLDGSNVFYPRVIGERDPNDPFCWRWGFNWKEKHNGVWKGKSIGSMFGFSGSCAGLRAGFGLSGVVGVSLLRLEVGWFMLPPPDCRWLRQY